MTVKELKKILNMVDDNVEVNVAYYAEDVDCFLYQDDLRVTYHPIKEKTIVINQVYRSAYE